ncbi:hypothetical protein [Methylobacterium isbiliense]|uniref:hypothetical protein n=1 Tax=Methylobacterium isbiliense TaxID=315478 RepID=UPI001EE1CF27|nr:hypothetical protein [Methylobacterium isbiliense]MDN3626188.1 hypothetical protein [Methylobacterium isbiliense]
MRLLHNLVAVLLALAVGIFPVAAAASSRAMLGGAQGGHHLTTVHEAAASAAEDAVALDATRPDQERLADMATHRHHQSSGKGKSDSNASCCQLACHTSFQASAVVPFVVSRTPVLKRFAVVRDAQVAGGPSSRIERPPRSLV